MGSRKERKRKNKLKCLRKKSNRKSIESLIPPMKFPPKWKPYRGIVDNAPRNLCFVSEEDYEETMEFLASIESRLEAGKICHIDLGKVKKLTREPLIYIYSLFERFKDKKKGHIKSIWGPNNKRVDEIICSSGLLDLLESRHKKLNKDVFKVSRAPNMHAEKYKPSVIDPVMQFCKKNLLSDKFDDDYFVELSSVTSEAAGNAAEHAYTEEEKGKLWWIGAVNHPSYVRVFIMDNGKGIIKSIHEDLKGKFSSLFKSQKELKILNDVLNILHKYSSRPEEDGKGFGGNGLHSIHCSYAEENIIDGLYIYSNNVYYINGKYIKSNYNFSGTMIILEIKKEQ